MGEFISPKAVVAAFGQPHYPQVMGEFMASVKNPHKAWHQLGKAGMEKAMKRHVTDLRAQGQSDLARIVLIEMKTRFNNVTRPN